MGVKEGEPVDYGNFLNWLGFADNSGSHRVQPVPAPAPSAPSVGAVDIVDSPKPEGPLHDKA